MLIRSGCFGAGFGEGEPLVAEVGDDLQAAAGGWTQAARVRSSVVPGLACSMADTRPWVMLIRAATWAWVMLRRPCISAGRKARWRSRQAALAAVLAAVAGWQLSPFKQYCLRGCHRSFSLPPRGWRAETGALRFGLRNGLYCLGTCWCLMLVMVAVPGGQLLWTVGLTGVITAERLLPRSRSATRVVAALLGFAAVAALAVGNLLQ